jgi:hypothetical protein
MPIVTFVRVGKFPASAMLWLVANVPLISWLDSGALDIGPFLANGHHLVCRIYDDV